MVTTNVDPMSGVSGMVKQIDNPGVRRKSYTDGEFWDAEARDRLGVRKYVRLEIPNTNKADMKKYAELVIGLGTQMQYIAANTAMTESIASMQFRMITQLINQELKVMGKLDVREQKNRGKQKLQRNRTNTKSGNSGAN